VLGWSPGWPVAFGARTQKSAGQASQVRTAFLEMQLDHDSGAMYGRILSGRYEGVALDALDVATLMSLFGEIDSDSRDLLAAYLDRREAGWREHAQGDMSGGRSEAPRGGKMTEQEAYLILGIKPRSEAAAMSRSEVADLCRGRRSHLSSNAKWNSNSLRFTLRSKSPGFGAFCGEMFYSRDG
jgi:hypothetical protein